MQKNSFLLALAFLWLLLPINSLQAQNTTKNHMYFKEYSQADSLLNQGLPESARKVVQEILAKANAANNKVEQLKANLYLMKTGSYQEDAQQEQISFALAQLRSASFPNDAIWHSILASLYWQYYQQQQYQILQRTPVQGEAGADLAFWDARTFYNTISQHFQNSLADKNSLKNIAVATYDPVIIKGENTRHLRPTLFDLLAFRAINFYQNDSKELINAAYSFSLDKESYFAPASSFAAMLLSSADTFSLHWKALLLYQEIIKLHLNDANPDALIDADLARLEFVHTHTVLGNKKELYKASLNSIIAKYPSNATAALARFRKAALDYNVAPLTSSYHGPSLESSNGEKRNIPNVVKQLNDIIERFPNTNASTQAHNLLQSILQKTLSLTTEEVLLPNQANKALLSYKNTPTIKYSLYKIPYSKWQLWNREGNEQATTFLKGQSPVYTKNINLRSVDDYEQHHTEILIEPLPLGAYILIAFDGSSLDASSTVGIASTFQVSELSVVRGHDVLNNLTPLYVLHRESGKPIPNADVSFFRNDWNNSRKAYSMKFSAASKTDERGRWQKLNLGSNQSYSGLQVLRGSDTLRLESYFHHYSEGREDWKRHQQSFLFTDRAIYRPGQTVYFKAILVDIDPTGQDNKVVPAKEISVKFLDANGQEVSKQSLTTNEFGSIQGNFKTPEGVLTGRMTIQTDYGSVGIQVEEYKRPKFQVAFDTLKGNYLLGETVTLTGVATAYAGQKIDNAQVKYRVMRTARWPYYWFYYRWGMPHSPAVAIANGTTTTDAEGRYTISFPALPDLAIDPKTEPIFSYQVTADITDVNGETRSADQTVQVAYKSILISQQIPVSSDKQGLDTLRITTKNMNNVFVPASVSIKIYKLRSPENILRKRLWPAPDQPQWDSLSFKKLFPLDEFANESDPLNWEREKLVYQKNITTTQEGTVAIDRSVWAENGHYEIEMQTQDRKGQPVMDKAVVQLWDEENKGILKTPAFSTARKEVWEPGENAQIHLVTGFEESYWLMQTATAQDQQAAKEISLNDHHYSWSKTLTEKDRGGVLANWLTVKNNRFYQTQTVLQVPWDNKDLDISWETHRDKLLPAEKETWTMVIRGAKKEKVAAEMMATLYDASLDAFAKHQWMKPYLYPQVHLRQGWNYGIGFGTGGSYQLIYNQENDYKQFPFQYDELLPIGYREYYRADGMHVGGGRAMASVESQAVVVKSVQRTKSGVANEALAMQEEMAADASAPAPPPTVSDTAQQPETKTSSNDFSARKNLQELAFFIPDVRTDEAGNIRLSFQMPEALTKWNLLGFAHTKDFKTGTIQGSVLTQKELMVVPNMPRFVRQGDEINLSTKVNNLSANTLTGKATIQVVDALSGQTLDLPFGLQNTAENFTVAAGKSTEVQWKLRVPYSLYHPITIIVKATAGNFTDGEENTIPVLTNRMLVTETLPMPVRGNTTKQFRFDKLLNSPAYGTAGASMVHHALSLEYTPNPAWYVVQALPYMMEYPYECAEQTFNRMYANALAAHITQKIPKLESIFRKWEEEMQTDATKTAALLSNLEKNEELKSALLTETPWVLDAKNEGEQKKRIAYLFEASKMKRELNTSLRKLENMLMPDGAFPWFKGMYANEYITMYITTGIGRMQKLGVSSGKENMQRISSQTIPFLDRAALKRYQELIKRKAKMNEQQLSYIDVHYLFMRSYYKSVPIPADVQVAHSYYLTQIAKYWPSYNAYLKGMMALTLHRNGDVKTAANIIASLNETSISHPEMGKYWKELGNSWWWWEAPIEAQALLIECYNEVTQDASSVDDMRVWLLKQKQTQNWKTTKATADACYAFLLGGTSWVSESPEVVIQLGKETIRSSEEKQQAGTGYFKKRYEAAAVKPEMGNISVTVKTNQPAANNSTSWGAVYWQYFEDLDKITSAATNLVLRKQLFLKQASDRGDVLVPITAQTPLQVGDRVTVRIEIENDRAMEYVHLKDMRASCFEPVNVISGYRWANGLGYYESTKDVSSNFFIDYLPKGKFVFEYPVFVNNAGNFSNGISSIQCMYAPEFSAHSEGSRVEVQR